MNIEFIVSFDTSGRMQKKLANASKQKLLHRNALQTPSKSNCLHTYAWPFACANTFCLTGLANSSGYIHTGQLCKIQWYGYFYGSSIS